MSGNRPDPTELGRPPQLPATQSAPGAHGQPSRSAAALTLKRRRDEAPSADEDRRSKHPRISSLHQPAEEEHGQSVLARPALQSRALPPILPAVTPRPTLPSFQLPEQPPERQGVVLAPFAPQPRPTSGVPAFAAATRRPAVVPVLRLPVGSITGTNEELIKIFKQRMGGKPPAHQAMVASLGRYLGPGGLLTVLNSPFGADDQPEVNAWYELSGKDQRGCLLNPYGVSGQARNGKSGIRAFRQAFGKEN